MALKHCDVVIEQITCKLCGHIIESEYSDLDDYVIDHFLSVHSEIEYLDINIKFGKSELSGLFDDHGLEIKK